MGYQLLARSNDTVKRTLLGPKGLSLKWRKRAEIVKSSPYPRVESPQGNELNSVLNMTKAQLAKALSPVVLRDGQEYIGKPSAAFLSRISDDGINRRIGPYSPLARDKEEHVNVNQGILPKSGIIGADNRVVRRNNTEYPWSTVAYLPLDSGGYSGTGTRIGPSTALTAAHVVHNGTNWLELPELAPGSDYQDPVSFPFGQFGCYTVTIPTAWINNAGGDSLRLNLQVAEISLAAPQAGRVFGQRLTR